MKCFLTQTSLLFLFILSIFPRSNNRNHNLFFITTKVQLIKATFSFSKNIYILLLSQSIRRSSLKLPIEVRVARYFPMPLLLVSCGVQEQNSSGGIFDWNARIIFWKKPLSLLHCYLCRKVDYTLHFLLLSIFSLPSRWALMTKRGSEIR